MPPQPGSPRRCEALMPKRRFAGPDTERRCDTDNQTPGDFDVAVARDGQLRQAGLVEILAAPAILARAYPSAEGGRW